MKVLVAGGMKTFKIVEALESKFTSSGIDLIQVDYMNDIETVYSKGEYYDKAIIIEQAWNMNGITTDEFEIRRNISDFAQMSFDRNPPDVTYIFVTKDEHTASMVYEETLIIRSRCCVVMKETPYYVSFFSKLIQEDQSTWSNQLVYEPKIDTTVKEEDSHTNILQEIQDVGSEPTESFNIQDMDSFDTDIDSIGDNNFDIDFGDFGSDFNLDSDTVDEEDKEEFEMEEDNGNGELVDDLEDLFNDETSFNEETQETQEYKEDIELHIPIKEDTEDLLDEPTNYNEEDSSHIDLFDGLDDLEIEDTDVNEHTQDTDNINLEFETTQDEPTETEQVIDNQSADLADIYSLFDDEAKEEELHTDNKQIPIEIEDTTEEEIKAQDKFESSSKTNKKEKSKDRRESKRDKRDKRNTNQQESKTDLNIAKQSLDIFATRGTSIVLTGSDGSGKSVLAYNLANTLVALGYRILLVDMDTHGRTQSYISRSNYRCIQPDSANLMQSLKSSVGINAYVAVPKPGFNLLTMGIGGDIVELSKMIQPTKINRFANLSKSSYNFVIYDIPFKEAVSCASDITFMADDIVLVSECSNWGLTKTMIDLFNIESEDMRETMFTSSQLLLNKCSNVYRIMGKKVKSIDDIVNSVDSKLHEIIGEEPDYKFAELQRCLTVERIEQLEEFWFEDKQYSDTQEGFNKFVDLICSIVLKKQ